MFDAAQIKVVGTGSERALRVAGELPDDVHGAASDGGYLCPLDALNASAIRRAIPWAGPERVGKRKSFGFGDRLGVATPGHLAAARTDDMFPVLAQQSIREMERAGRTPQEVLDDVTWAVVETGYREGWASDADHVKTPEEIDLCVDAGFLGFTLDPGDFVDDDAGTAGSDRLRERLGGFPWEMLASNPDDHQRFYISEHGFSEEEYLRAAVKYGRAVARAAELDAHLAWRFGGGDYDLEVSVDETDSATTPAQHRYIALELGRLDVDFIGLAPRLVGSFYKGVDYVGDLDAFDADYAAHAAVAKELGPYKLSIHSGSDKLSVYSIANRHTPEHVHVKTSGTSWLEALRIVAGHDAALFRGILALAVEGYDVNRRSYYLDGRTENIPEVSDDRLPTLLDDRDARQVLHVAFGPVLGFFHDPIYAVLDERIDAYHEALRRHFEKHLAAFHR